MYCKKFTCGKSITNNDFKLLQKHGHRPIVLLGGGTTLIGDPSGKDATRKILDYKEIKKNIVSIKKFFQKFWIIKIKKLNQFL